MTAKTAGDYLDEMEDAELRCRASHRHLFWSDSIDPGATSIPRQVHVARRKGVFQIEEACLRGCGIIRTWTSARGLFGPDTVYGYRRAPGSRRVVIPDTAGVRMTSRDYKAELFRRAAEDGPLRGLLEAAADATERDLVPA